MIGISKDTPQKHAKFRAKYDLKCDLGADHDTDIFDQFGVWVEKSIYGRTYMGIHQATFVIVSSGKVAAVWPKVKVDNHAAEVLEFIKSCSRCLINQHYHPRLLSRLKQQTRMKKPTQHRILLPHGVPINLTNLAAPRRQIDPRYCHPRLTTPPHYRWQSWTYRASSCDCP